MCRMRSGGFQCSLTDCVGMYIFLKGGMFFPTTDLLKYVLRGGRGWTQLFLIFFFFQINLIFFPIGTPHFQ